MVLRRFCGPVSTTLLMKRTGNLCGTITHIVARYYHAVDTRRYPSDSGVMSHTSMPLACSCRAR